MFGRKPLLDGVSARGLVGALALAVGGLVGAVPALCADGLAEADRALAAWLALAAPALGALGPRAGLRFWPLGLVPPAVWMTVGTLAAARALHGPPTPLYGALVVTGLFALGWAVARATPRAGWATPGALLLVAAALASLTALLELLELDGQQALAALALDASPLACVMESAGVDWMRDASVYDVAGSLPPDVRTPYRGILAGPLAVLVGCSLALVLEGRRSGVRADRADAPESP